MSPTILIVDDDPWQCELLSLHLAELGVNPLTTISASEALVMLENTSCDLVVLDVMMPELDGVHLRDRLRQDVRWSHLPVLFVSAADADGSQAARARPFVAKTEGPAAVVAWVARWMSVRESQASARPAADLPTRARRPDARVYPFIKRGLDVLVAFVGLALCLPLFVLLATLIFLEDRGGPFYSQIRIGRGGRRFRCWKIRSMCRDADALRTRIRRQLGAGDDQRFKARNDPRLLRIGKIIRGWSLDELPQLWNILRGDMSLVGPRPPIPEEVDRYSLEAWSRLDVRPGLTCFWQVEGRALLPFDEQVKRDRRYIQERGLLTDLSLLVRTIPAVLARRGAW